MVWENFTFESVGEVAARTFVRTLPSLATASKLAGAAFVAFGAALYYGQTYLIYPAYAPTGSRTDVPTPDKHGMPRYEDLTLETPDKLKIKAYLILQGAGLSSEEALKEAKRRPTVLFLQANAGNMGHRLPFAHIFYDRLKCNVFMLSYRGYGLSEGKPNEKGIRMDAQLALDYITSHPALEGTKIVLYGQSIGGAVSVDLAASNPDKIAGIILENTFLSLPKIAMSVMPVAAPYILMGLLTEKWNSKGHIQKMPEKLPMLFLAGQQDELVPPSQFMELFKLCSSQRKRMRQFLNGNHNDTCVQPNYWREVQQWIHDEIAAVPDHDKINSTSNRDAEKDSGDAGVSPSSSQHQHQPRREGTFDERRMDGAEKELEGSIGAGSLAP